EVVPIFSRLPRPRSATGSACPGVTVVRPLLPSYRTQRGAAARLHMRSLVILMARVVVCAVAAYSCVAGLACRIAIRASQLARESRDVCGVVFFGGRDWHRWWGCPKWAKADWHDRRSQE